MVQRLTEGDEGIYPDENGTLVEYEDYVKLQQERDALQQLIQMAYDAPTSDEGMHWVYQGVNNLAEWMAK